MRVRWVRRIDSWAVNVYWLLTINCQPTILISGPHSNGCYAKRCLIHVSSRKKYTSKKTMYQRPDAALSWHSTCSTLLISEDWLPREDTVLSLHTNKRVLCVSLICTDMLLYRFSMTKECLISWLLIKVKCTNGVWSHIECNCRVLKTCKLARNA